jgi:type IV secretory pathway TraG/TraD family ATPase VirD4
MSWSKEFSMGGEAKRHESKLFFHNITNLIMIALILGLVFGGTWNWLSSGALKRKYFFTYGYSYWFTAHPGEPKTAKNKLVFIKDVSNYWLPAGKKPNDKDIEFRMAFASRKKGRLLSWPDGKPVIEWRVKIKDSNAYAYLKKSIYQKTFPALIGNFLLSVMCIAGIVMFPVAFSWIRTGREKMLDRFIRGTRAVVPERANQLIKKSKQHGGLKIGEVWLPRGTESQHMFMVGGSGSGKTSAMFQLLYQLRQLQAKVLVCDTKLDFVSTFYEPGTDFIASPLDERSIYYSLHAEGSDVQTAESTAFSLVQEDYGSANQFFVDAAQSVVAETILVGARQGQTTNAWFWKTITSKLSVLSEQLEGTEAGAHLDPTGERTAHSVRSTVLNHVRIFKYLADPPSGRQVFSMRKWVANGESGFGFVCLRPRMRNIGRSLVSLLLEQAALELLDMPDQEPGEFLRLFLFIDELPVLQRLPNLVGNLATLRSKGCAVILATQSFSQIRSIYGPDDAASIASLTGHHLVFRSKEPETQDWCSRLLGSAEYYQMTEALSMGETSKADRSSHNEQRREIRSVLASELKDLPDRFCWLSLSGNFPITLTEIPKLPRPQNQRGFVARNDIDLSGIVHPHGNDDLF